MKKGFTLIEFLVVVAIVGLLATFILGSIRKGGNFEVDCSIYKWTSQKDIPAQCVSYYNNSK